MGVLNPGALNAGTSEGQVQPVLFGSTYDELIWINGAWIGKSRSLFTFRDLDAMDAAGGGGTGNLNYMSTAFSQSPMSSALNEPLRPTRPWGWNPHAVRDADLGFASGMTLETKLMTNHWGWEANSSYDIALVMYPLGVGDSISPTIDPDDHVANVLAAIPTVRAMHSTDWVEWPLALPTKKLLAPHFYTRYNSGTDTNSRIEYAAAWARWKYQP